MNLAQLAIDNIEKFGVYESLIFEGRSYTNVELENMTRSFSRALAGLGVQRGDRVGFVLANCPEVVVCFGACFRMGAWAMPVVFVLTADQMGYIFEHSGAKAIVTHSIFLARVREACKVAPNVKHIIIADKARIEGTISMQELIENNIPEFDMVDCAEDDIAMLMYTSGTTGRPKGVMLSHKNLHSDALMSMKGQEMEPGSMGLSVLPLNHSYGVITMLVGSLLGVRGVLLPWFNAELTLQLIEKHRVQHTAMVPTMFVQLLAAPNREKCDASSMKRWICAAAPLSRELMQRFEAAFPGVVLEGYGLTETSPAVAINSEDQRKPGSVGKPLEGEEVTIRDEEGNILPAGQPGEICVRGPNVMKGYYMQPEETAKIISGGWLHTGDIGYLDDEGFLFITDRKKDLIIRGGENIYPSDIEEILEKHPDIAEVAIIGRKDPVYGEQVMAVIVAKSGSNLTEQSVLDFCGDKLAKYQRPKWILFADSLPKNALGKVLKKQLREQYGQ